jgi:hypothetical protein
MKQSRRRWTLPIMQVESQSALSALQGDQYLYQKPQWQICWGLFLCQLLCGLLWRDAIMQRTNISSFQWPTDSKIMQKKFCTVSQRNFSISNLYPASTCKLNYRQVMYGEHFHHRDLGEASITVSILPVSTDVCGVYKCNQLQWTAWQRQTTQVAPQNGRTEK